MRRTTSFGWKKCNEQWYGVSDMLYCQSVAYINVWDRRKFISWAPQLAPVPHYHHCSLLEALKLFVMVWAGLAAKQTTDAVPFISPCAWISLLFYLLTSECVWKRKQGQDLAHLNHFPFSGPMFLYHPCVDQQDDPILHILAKAGTVQSHPHPVTGLTPEKVRSFASLRGGSVS